jgi:hypothetical protein
LPEEHDMPVAHPVIDEIKSQLQAFAHLPDEQRADKFFELRDRIKDEHRDLYSRLAAQLGEPHRMDPEDVRRYFETEIASVYLHSANPADPAASERLARAIRGETLTGSPTLGEQFRRAYTKAVCDATQARPCGKVKNAFFSGF